MPGLIAAGAVLWRRQTSGGVEVAVVHRPRYDDWSWPKGKPSGDEPLPVTAVREVWEETGHRAVLGRRLRCTRYPVAWGEKVVHYWAARAEPGTFVPSEEVGELRWLPPEQAGELLTYPHDRRLLTDLDGALAVCSTVLLVRHAKAGKREQWTGEDHLRPLTAAGKQQAEELRRVLPLFGTRRVYSAPRTRCQQTVEGLAADLEVPVLDEPLMSEEDYLADPVAAVVRLLEIAAENAGPTVVCSQGGVIPDLLRRLAAPTGHLLPEPPPSPKGSFWALSFGTGSSSGSWSAGSSGAGSSAAGSPGPGSAPPTLLEADYYDAPRR